MNSINNTLNTHYVQSQLAKYIDGIIVFTNKFL